MRSVDASGLVFLLSCYLAYSVEGQLPIALQSSRCVCHLDYRPVCSKENQTFPSACSAMCQKKLLQCHSPCPCPVVMTNVTVEHQSEGEEASLLTEAVLVEQEQQQESDEDESDEFEEEDNSTAPNCGCPTAPRPVCDRSNATLPNLCVARCKRRTVACQTACPCGPLEQQQPADDDDKDVETATMRPVATKPPPPSIRPPPVIPSLQLNPCTCEQRFLPVCGVNDETYDNECYAGCKEVRVRCNGYCPCKAKEEASASADKEKFL